MAEERGWRLVQGTEVGADGAVVFTGQYADANPAVGETDDRRIALLRARIKAHRSEATRLEVELDVVLAARAAGVSLWSTELPPLFLQQLLQLVWSWPWAQRDRGAIRAVCSTWCIMHDALYAGQFPAPSAFRPPRWAAVMVGKLVWFESVTEVNLLDNCDKHDVSSVLGELGSMPSLRMLELPAICAERAVDAEAVCGLTTLTTLGLWGEADDYDQAMEEADWVLDLSRLKSLTSLDVCFCAAVTDLKEVQALSSLTGLTSLKLAHCPNVTGEGLRAVSSLTSLELIACDNVKSEGLRAVIK